MELKEKIVHFDEYCTKCAHEKEDESDVNSACYECLDNPSNTYSHKPINFKEK